MLSTLRLGCVGRPHEQVLPGIYWGHPDQVFTPAYWASLCTLLGADNAYYNPAISLIEHVAFCLLGGYGITAEMNEAAFVRLQTEGLLGGGANRAKLQEALQAPLSLNGRSVQYRFPKQRSERIALALGYLSYSSAPEDALSLRRWLLNINGVGYKTASWVVRNFTASDEVAILDVHVIRACQIIGLFGADACVRKQYLELESGFVAFSKAIGASAALLDALMWRNMRSFRSRLLYRNF